MKKNFTVNIGGLIFHIDEDAYEILSAYLERLKLHFAKEEGHEEIISDIERRIAEMLQQKITETKQVICTADVTEIITQMGEPVEFDASSESNQRYGNQKRFYRNPDEKIIGGVCGGLAAYFNINPQWIRLIFILVTLLGAGIGIVAYLIIWLIVPEAYTTAERLEMKGKKVNISNIEQSLKEELQGINKRLNDFRNGANGVYKKSAKESRNLFEKVFGLIISVFGHIFRAFVVFLGLICIAAGVFLLIGILVSFMTFEHVYYVSSYGINTFSIPAFLNILLGPSDQSIAIIGTALVTGIPLLVLIYIGSRLIFRFKSRSRFVGIPAFSLFLVGLIFCAVSGINLMKNFSQTANSQKTVCIKQPQDNTLKIRIKSDPKLKSILDNENSFEIGSWNIITNEDTSISFGRPSLEIIESANDSIYLSLIANSRGKDKSQALSRANHIIYNYKVSDTALVLDPYFFLPEREKFRGQKLKIVIAIPENKQIDIQKDAGQYLNFIQ